MSRIARALLTGLALVAAPSAVEATLKPAGMGFGERGERHGVPGRHPPLRER